MKKSHLITAGISLAVSVVVTYLSNRNSTVRRSIG
ncbi:hypothetical protein SVI_2189 [Shewanella violacea DSS12]|uniref:Uncharacterized protein n=1 Tax=Shewanella violacea (strain JCM 10179 / CIP 106290 / LMG 19151 / DSS12) TaxID=637905 RepID=D4ZKG1_SHEVD|nr:hypothetical protein SVI_2189 [Shewanella violacea DSS12]